MSKASDRLNKYQSSISKISAKKNKPKLKSPHPTKKIMHHKHGDHLNVPIEKLCFDPDQPRKNFDEQSLQELSESIKDRGILQPILIRFVEEKFWIVAGERRVRAANMASLEFVPCIVTTGEPSEISLIENIQRENLSHLELATALHKMMHTHKYTQEQVGKIIGKSQRTVSHILSIFKLPEPILDDFRNARLKDITLPEIPLRSIVAITQASNEEEAIELYNDVKKGATSEEIREKRQAKTVDKDKVIKKRSKLQILNSKIDLLIKTFEGIDDPQRFKVKLRANLKRLDEQLSRFR